MISIVVPTLNERARITGLLESLSALPGEKEIVVADGDSTDGTAEAAEASAFEAMKSFSLALSQTKPEHAAPYLFTVSVCTRASSAICSGVAFHMPLRIVSIITAVISSSVAGFCSRKNSSTLRSYLSLT